VNCVLQSILCLPRVVRSTSLSVSQGQLWLFFLTQLIDSFLSSKRPLPPLASRPHCPLGFDSFHLLSPHSLTRKLLLLLLDNPRNRNNRKAKKLSSHLLSSLKRSHLVGRSISDHSSRSFAKISPQCLALHLLTVPHSLDSCIAHHRTNSQADAMEFLTYFLDKLHEEMLTGLQEPQQTTFHRDDEFSLAETTTPGAEDEWEEVGRGGSVNHVDQASRRNAVMLNNSTIISSIFHGTLR
jgi:hypothetical protein